jgi:hypothetical protein
LHIYLGDEVWVAGGLFLFSFFFAAWGVGLLIARADELCGAFSREFEVLEEFVKF